MPTIEDRLFNCIDENLRRRDEVIEEYGNRMDFMRDYSFRHCIPEHIAAALNLYKQGAGIEPADIGEYHLLHGSEAVEQYEQKHGIKNFLFCIRVQEENWKKIALKIGLPEILGGVYLSAIYFSDFKFSPLYFNTFGFGIGYMQDMFAHESLHMGREIYSTNAMQLKALPDNPGLTDNEWIAKLEFAVAEEVLAYMGQEQTKEEITEKIEGFYPDYYTKRFASRLPCLNEDERQKKTEEISRIIEPARKSLKLAVDSSFVLKSWLPFDVLTPLFYSLGPTLKEMKAKEFDSPFLDLTLWAVMLQHGRIKPDAIKEALQKKGYCLESKF